MGFGVVIDLRLVRVESNLPVSISISISVNGKVLVGVSFRVSIQVRVGTSVGRGLWCRGVH